MSLVVIDGFLSAEAWDEVRAQALKEAYTPWYGAFGTEAVKRSARVPVLPVIEALIEHLGAIEVVHSGFRLDYEGELPHTLVHFDDDCGEAALVLYLNPASQCRGGTGFWQHLPTRTVCVDSGMPKGTLDELRADGQDDSKWAIDHLIGMRPNRAVIYPTANFHSRLPFTGWGTSPEDGRLVCGVFFNFQGDNK